MSISLRAIRQPETSELRIVYALGHHEPLEFFKTFLDYYSTEPGVATACLADVQQSTLQDKTPVTRIIL